jgi:ankyrin repeat protein
MARGNTNDKGRVAVKREKEEDERENEEEEEERKKQKVEEADQERLNKKFLDACYKKKLKDVKGLVERGADLFFCNINGANALHCACSNKNYEAAEEIVVYLIKKQKGLLRMVSNDQWSALHYAAYNSSAKICEILIDNGCDVNGTTKYNETPLALCCERIDEDALKVAKLLIERGTDLSENGGTALHYACLQGRDDVVQTLVDSKVDVNALKNNGGTPLMYAARNRFFGEKIIPILIQAGADVTMKNNNGKTAVNFCYASGGGKMLKALAPFVPEGCTDLNGFLPGTDCPDPIGSMTEGLHLGFVPKAASFSYRVSRGDPPSKCWALLRNGEFDLSNIFETLSGSGDPDLWRTCATELWQRSAGSNLATGETILHLAVKCTKLSAENKLKVIQHIASFFINPLVLDNDNKRAIDYCTKEEKELHHILANYQQWKPDKKVMDWYGPYCRQRLAAFLMVEKRLKLGFPRDLRHLILSYVAEREYIWVPKKK